MGFAFAHRSRTRCAVVHRRRSDIRGRTRRVTLGKWPTFRVAQAREWAREIRSFKMDLRRSTRPRSEARRGGPGRHATTTRSTMHAEPRCGRSGAQPKSDRARSATSCDRHVCRLDGPTRLPLITRNECAERHERITARGGPLRREPRRCTSLRAVLQHGRASLRGVARHTADGGRDLQQGPPPSRADPVGRPPGLVRARPVDRQPGPPRPPAVHPPDGPAGDGREDGPLRARGLRDGNAPPAEAEGRRGPGFHRARCPSPSWRSSAAAATRTTCSTATTRRLGVPLDGTSAGRVSHVAQPKEQRYDADGQARSGSFPRPTGSATRSPRPGTRRGCIRWTSRS